MTCVSPQSVAGPRGQRPGERRGSGFLGWGIAKKSIDGLRTPPQYSPMGTPAGPERPRGCPWAILGVGSVNLFWGPRLKSARDFN